MFTEVVLIGVLVFLATAGLLVAVSFRLGRYRRRTLSRLRDLGSVAAGPERPSVEGLAASFRVGDLLMPEQSARRAKLQARLARAGLYSRNALNLFLGVKMLLLAVLPLMVLVASLLLKQLTFSRALVIAGMAAGVGLLAPNFWLDARTRRRQRELCRGLPDMLDMMVLCLEGGLSLTAALQRVTAELRSAHPLLAAEMNLVQREVQLGLSTGDALRQFGERADIEEVRSLASVLLQAERYGASMVKALRVHADVFRVERQQRAEEMAQKAAVKILFPTLVCIFPAIFVVILGPAAVQLRNMLAGMR